TIACAECGRDPDSIRRLVRRDQPPPDEHERPDRIPGPENVGLRMGRLGHEPVEDAGALRLLGVEHRPDGEARLLLEVSEDGLGDHLIHRGVDHDLATPARASPEHEDRDREEDCAGSGVHAEARRRASYFGAAVRSSNWMTESALVQTPNLPASVKVLSWASMTFFPS